jgi:hypothetical protein
MTGAPAETWRKFSFVTAPWWTYFFGLIVRALVARRASGYLPLTRASDQKLRVVTWVSAGLMLLTILLWIGAIVGAVSSDDPNVSAAAGLLFFLGLFSILGAAIGWLVVKPQIGPAGKVMEQQVGHYDKLVELRHVHPAFVIAVQQRQQARAAQYAYAPQSLQPK